MQENIECTSCGQDATTDCVSPTNRKLPAVKRTKHFALKGLGPKHSLKPIDQKSRQALATFVRTFNGGKLYRYLFTEMWQKARQLTESSYHAKLIMSKINGIIPMRFLTTLQNKKRFLKLVKLCLTRSHTECIFVEEFTRGFDLSVVKWLPQSASNSLIKMNIFAKGIEMVLVKIIIPMIHKVFTFIPTRSFEYTCMLRTDYNVVINKLINYLKRHGIISYMPGFDIACDDVAYLICKPKKDVIQEVDLNTFRIIAMLPKRKDNNIYIRKEINKAVRDWAKRSTFVKSTNFFKAWSTFVRNEDIRHKRLFIAKLDLSDCFGNIPKTDLILQVLAEADNPLSMEYQGILIRAMQRQYIAFGIKRKTRNARRPIMWRWNHGLLQGMKFSSSLCDLYMSNIESKVFEEFKRPNCFIFRTVDDYFFASTKREDVLSFMEIAKRTFKINDAKTECNFAMERGGDRNTVIKFCGLLINARSYKIKCAFHTHAAMYKRFRFWNVLRTKDRDAILAMSLQYNYNNFYFQPALMNVAFNGRNHVYDNYFESMVYIAYKFETAIMSATNRTLKKCYAGPIFIQARKTSKDYAAIVGRKNAGVLGVPIHFLEYVGLRAFELVFSRKSNATYQEVVKNIRERLKKRSGDKHNKKENELRMLLRRFEKIPESLQSIKLARNIKFCQLSRQPLTSVK